MKPSVNPDTSFLDADVVDLVVNRGPLDRIISAGGYISVNTGNAPDGNSIAVPKLDADNAMDAAACIGCGACVAACPNGSASLFTAAKISIAAAMTLTRSGSSSTATHCGRALVATNARSLVKCLRNILPYLTKGSSLSAMSC